jgi:hypothetical protein
MALRMKERIQRKLAVALKNARIDALHQREQDLISQSRHERLEIDELKKVVRRYIEDFLINLLIYLKK